MPSTIYKWVTNYLTTDMEKTQTGLIPRKELAQMPQVLKALTRAEQLILRASVARKVREYNGEGLAAALAQILPWIARDIGYTIKGAEDLQYIVVRTAELLKRYYEEITVDEFRLAFELALTGELNPYLPRDKYGLPDTGHYNQFGAEYICKILNAYRSLRNASLRRAEAVGPKPEQKSLITDGERERNARQMRAELRGAFLHYKYRGWLPRLSPIQAMRFYQILAGVGLADEVEVTDAERRAVLEQTAIHYASSGMVGDLTRLKREGLDSVEIQGRSYIAARLRTLRDAFKEMIKDEIQISDYV